MQFRNGTGWNYEDYKFKVTKSSNGKKYKPKKFQMVFDTLEAYIAFYTESKIYNKDFDYEVIETIRNILGNRKIKRVYIIR